MPQGALKINGQAIGRKPNARASDGRAGPNGSEIKLRPLTRGGRVCARSCEGGNLAHIWVVVCLPPDAIDDVQTALAKALAPFEMYEQPAERGMWDTWRIRGGGEGAGFYVRPGFEDDPRLIHDTPN